MITFLNNMVYVLEALGFEFFTSQDVAIGTFAQDRSSLDVRVTGAFYTTALPKSDSAKAYLDLIDDVYILRAGSFISKIATDSLPSNVRKLRDQLIRENTLIDAGNCFRLERDISFAKPSPASAFVKGRSSTGHGDWLRTTDKKRLGQVLLGS
jgi:hypothetical protein